MILARVISIFVSDYISNIFQFNDWISALYLPAGVNIICLAVIGPLAAVGIGFGSLIWGLINLDISFVMLISLSIASAVASGLSVIIFEYLFARRNGGLKRIPNLKSVTFFIIIYALINSAVHHLVFIMGSDAATYGIKSYMLMVEGDILGGLIFILSVNFLTSIWLAGIRMRLGS